MSSLSPWTEIPGALNHDLVLKLSLLHGAPPGIAESTIALLGFGARALLAESIPPLIEMTDERPAKITITPEGWNVIEACGKYVEQAGEHDWESRVDEDSWTKNHAEKLAGVLDTLGSDSDSSKTSDRHREREELEARTG